MSGECQRGDLIDHSNQTADASDCVYDYNPWKYYPDYTRRTPCPNCGYCPCCGRPRRSWKYWDWDVPPYWTTTVTCDNSGDCNIYPDSSPDSVSDHSC
jgi:hypothetical protein